MVDPAPPPWLYATQGCAGFLTKARVGSETFPSTSMNAICAEGGTPRSNARVLQPSLEPLSQCLATSKTPVRVNTLALWLNDYPDQRAVELLRSGFTLPFLFHLF